MRHPLVPFSILFWALALFARAGPFVALAGADGFRAEPGDMRGLVAKLSEKQGEKAALKMVAFTPQGDWVLLFGRNGLWTSNINLPVIQKLESLWKEPWPVFHCVTFAPWGASVAFWNRNSFWTDGTVPPAAMEKIREVAARDGELRSLAFAPGGGWVLLYDRSEAAFAGIPDGLACILRDAASAQNPVQCVSFNSAGQWLCLGEKGWWASDPAARESQAVADLSKSGTPPRWIALAWEGDSHFPYRLEIKPAERIHATLTTDITLPAAQVEHWYIYTSQVPNLPGQQDVISTLEPDASMTREYSPLHRPLLLSHSKTSQNSVETIWTIDATLMSRQLLPLAPGEKAAPVPPLAPELKTAFTAATPTVSYASPELTAWRESAGLRRRTGESGMALARRVFAYIKHHFTYEFPTTFPSATLTCKAGKSDCGGLSALFVATMRANGVPARMLGGRWATSSDERGQAFHVKAEFFADGVGWVPVDMSMAVHDPEGLDFSYFGNEDGHFLAMAEGEDMNIERFRLGRLNVPLFQGAYYFWFGRGSGRDASVVERWVVEKK